MPLTAAQYAQLATDIVADPALSQLSENGDSAVLVAHAYNVLYLPDYWVWKTRLMEQEVYEAVVDGLKWSWATFKAQTAQDRDAWVTSWHPGQVNPSLVQTRDGWLAIFGGQGASQVQVNYLLALGRRRATRMEKLFAQGTGAGSTQTPALMSVEGDLTAWDVEQCWVVR